MRQDLHDVVEEAQDVWDRVVDEREDDRAGNDVDEDKCGQGDNDVTYVQELKKGKGGLKLHTCFVLLLTNLF